MLDNIKSIFFEDKQLLNKICETVKEGYEDAFAEISDEDLLEVLYPRNYYYNRNQRSAIVTNFDFHYPDCKDIVKIIAKKYSIPEEIIEKYVEKIVNDSLIDEILDIELIDLSDNLNCKVYLYGNYGEYIGIPAEHIKLDYKPINLSENYCKEIFEKYLTVLEKKFDCEDGIVKYNINEILDDFGEWITEEYLADVDIDEFVNLVEVKDNLVENFIDKVRELEKALKDPEYWVGYIEEKIALMIDAYLTKLLINGAILLTLFSCNVYDVDYFIEFDEED